MKKTVLNEFSIKIREVSREFEQHAHSKIYYLDVGPVVFMHYGSKESEVPVFIINYHTNNEQRAVRSKRMSER